MMWEYKLEEGDKGQAGRFNVIEQTWLFDAEEAAEEVVKNCVELNGEDEVEVWVRPYGKERWHWVTVSVEIEYRYKAYEHD